MKEGKNTSVQRHSNTKKTKQTDNVVAAVAAAVEENWCLTVREWASMLDLTFATVQSALTINLGFVKTSVNWVPNLLTMAQKDERVQRSEDLIQLLWRHCLAALNYMDESTVSSHTPETKRQSKQWVKKGEPGPLKTKVHASRTSKWFSFSLTRRALLYRTMWSRCCDVVVGGHMFEMGNRWEQGKGTGREGGGGWGQYTSNLGPEWTGIAPHAKEGFQVSRRDSGTGEGLSRQRGLSRGYQGVCAMCLRHNANLVHIVPIVYMSC